MNVFAALAVALQTPGVNGQSGLSCLLWGPPGAGKTSKIHAIVAFLAKAFTTGLHLETVIAGLREPADFAGLPIINADGVNMAPPGWARRAAAAPRAVIFLDELSTAAPAVQKALLRAIFEGAVGDLQMPATVSWVAAANAVEHAADGYDLAPALANRLIHLDVESPSVEEWSSWLLSGGNQPMEVPILDVDKFDTEFRKARALAGAFVRNKPGSLLDVPKDESKSGKAWASPRSWEMGVRGYAAGMAVGNEEIAVALLVGAIGPGVGAEFSAFAREQDLPDPRELLKNPSAWAGPDKKRLDRALAILSAVAATALELKVKDDDERSKLVEAAWTLIDTTIKAKQPDIAVPAAVALVNARRGQKRGPTEVKSLGSLMPVLQAAGILGK